jgi:hypothetical protein
MVSANGFGLGEGGDFHHKCVCGALNRHFCQLKISEAKPVLCSRAIILSSNFFNPIQSKEPIAIAVYVRCKF